MASHFFSLLFLRNIAPIKAMAMGEPLNIIHSGDVIGGVVMGGVVMGDKQL